MDDAPDIPRVARLLGDPARAKILWMLIVLARPCVDLTQRRPHLGDALLDLGVARGWVLRQGRSRVVTITPEGAENFRRLFGA